MQDMYIARIPVNVDYTKGDMGNVYIFITPIKNKSKGNLLKIGRQIVEELQSRANYWPNMDSVLDLPDSSYIDFAARYVYKYHNVARMDYTKYGVETIFQHDSGSFGTDTRQVVSLI